MIQGCERSAAHRGNRAKYVEIFSQAAWRDAVGSPSVPCGDTRLDGEMRAGFAEGACYINAPVYLTGLAGVDLDRPIIISCTLARHLADWVESYLVEVSASFAREVEEIISYGSYNCRTIGNREGARPGPQCRPLRPLAYRDGATRPLARVTLCQSGAARCWNGLCLVLKSI